MTKKQTRTTLTQSLLELRNRFAIHNTLYIKNFSHKSATSATKSPLPGKPYRKFFTNVKLGIKMKNPASSLQDRQDRKRSLPTRLRPLRPLRDFTPNHTQSHQINLGGGPICTRLFSSFFLPSTCSSLFQPITTGYPVPSRAQPTTVDCGPWTFFAPRNYHKINSDRARSCRIVGWQGTTTRTGNSALRA